MSDKGNGFGTFLLGGLIGGAIALLYAPRSGEETRNMLAGEGQVVVEKAVSAIRDAQDTALTTIRDTQARLEELNTEAMDRISKLQDIAGSTLDEQKQSLKKGYSEAKKVVKENQEPETTTTVGTTTTTTPRG